ncbi:MAG: carbohydrate ABC transporter substrate-binding protein [Clostridia bacterium]|nr:carbohydrate ABC transporter substrate-binding protein [Clostridia bacterium]MBR5364866.1 carbohydrate ABC transporter substrate-binding protein [Clostridia bacterium]
MKRILSLLLTLALLLPCLAACESGDTPSASGGTTTSKPAQNADHEEAVEADYSDFEMPEETDSLTVYGYSFISNALSHAVEIFRSLYPDVKVDYQLLSQDEYDTRIRAEIPAGRGPDVLLGDVAVLPDIYKTMSTGVFTDLGGFMAKDEEYNPDDYYDSVMKGGVLFGCQYLLPVTFGVNCVMTTQELLDENGISTDSLHTWEGFRSACETFHTNHPRARLFAHDAPQYYYTIAFLNDRGLRMIDYEKNAVSFDENQFRQMIDLCRLYCNPTVPTDSLYGVEHEDIHNGECFLINGFSSIYKIFYTSELMRYDYGETPRIIGVPNEQDGITAEIKYYAAVPGGSANKLNAWRFIKILLTDELQYGLKNGDETVHFFNQGGGGSPVRKESFLKAVEEHASFYSLSTEEDREAFCQLAEEVTDAQMTPTIIAKYVTQYMGSYITSKDGSNYDKVFAKLKSTLELYKDE